ncbi:hypothetical protein CQW23_23642 [Capsicum baccatum]|uniref:Uncharacterized protein n=1 Tax=Capsicum baccatum TaxID=33114 RepID=A0A2G2VSJ7_CAPBA|nr:hypothetical protein CQW23_23642 [Capsicum baccatum]
MVYLWQVPWSLVVKQLPSSFLSSRRSLLGLLVHVFSFLQSNVQVFLNHQFPNGQIVLIRNNSFHSTYEKSIKILQNQNLKYSQINTSHPPEPVDTDLMKPVYIPIGSNKVDGKCLVKNISLKGPSPDDVSIYVLNVKPSSFVLSPAGRWAENPNDLGIVSSPFIVHRPSQNTLASFPPDSNEIKCLWDASLSTSSNINPHSSTDSYGVGTVMHLHEHI